MKQLPPLLIIIVLLFPFTAFPQAQSNGTYQVRSGDKLSHIAREFDLSLEQIIALNNIKNANDIYIGQTLDVSLKNVVIIEDTLIHSFSFKPSSNQNENASITKEVNTVLKQEGLLDTKEEVASTDLAVFTDAIWQSQFTAPIKNITFSSPEAWQGQSFSINVELESDAILHAYFIGQEFPFLANTPRLQTAFLAVPILQEPGIYPLDIEIRSLDGAIQNLTLPMAIGAIPYQQENLDIPIVSTSLLTEDTAQLEDIQITQICRHFDTTPYWDSGFRYPTDTPVITSEFGTNRSYTGSPSTSVHHGIDFKANFKIPIYASASGIVRLAQDLNIRGNTIIIDHGVGICTVYTHMSEVFINEGDTVTKDQGIGSAGSTGLTTQTHLHWELRIMGIAVNPKQWVSE